jgi:hypothetical protein
VPTQSYRQGGGHRRIPSTLPSALPSTPPPAPPPAAFRFEARPDEDDFGPDPEAENASRASAAAAGLVRWGAFSCALTPLTLLACGVPGATAFGTAAGLAALTAASGALLRRSEHAYAQQGPGRPRFTGGRPGPHRGRHSRTGTGLHRGERY